MAAPLVDQLTIVIKAGAGEGEVPAGLAGLPLTDAPEGKVSQDTAHYERATSDTTRCGKCTHYADHTCELVRGRISPSWVCDLFEARSTIQQVI